MAEAFRVFISAVTSEFALLRSRIKADLEVRGLSVAVQDDFRQEPFADTTLEKLHNYVRDCDAVICIIGRRSGDKPPPAASAPFAWMLPPNISEASYTQWEFFFASHYKQQQLIKYVAEDDYYFADCEYPPRPLAPDAQNFPQLQKDFVQHLLGKGLDRDHFASADELCRLIERQDWLAVPTSAWSLEGTFEPFLQPRSDSFLGREWLFERIVHWPKDDAERLLLLVGAAGTGKSAVMARFVDKMPCGPVLAYHFCQTDEPPTLEPFRFVRNLVYSLTHKLEGYREYIGHPRMQEQLRKLDKGGAPTEYFKTAVLRPLQAIKRPAELRADPGWIVIDALDEALHASGGEDDATIIDAIASGLRELPDWLRILATSRHGEVPDRLRELADPRGRRLVHELALDAADDADLFRRYIDVRLEETSKRVTRPARTLLLRQSQGNFLWLKMVLDGIVHGDYQPEDIKQLPPGLPAFYRHNFDRHYRDAAKFEQRVKPILAAMVAAREPLSAAGLAGATKMPEDEVQRELRTLAAYLTRYRNGYSIYHSSFSDWLLGQDGAHDYSISAAAGDSCLAEFCWRAFRGLPERAIEQGTNIVGLEAQEATAYMVRHGITHCLATGKVARATELLHFLVRNWDERRIAGSGFAAVSPARLKRALLRELDGCRDVGEKEDIEPSYLADLIKDFYQVEPLGAPLDILIRHHTKAWRRTTLKELLAAGNFVLRFRISDKLAEVCLSPKAPIKLTDIYGYLRSRHVNVHELGAYTLRRIYAQEPKHIKVEYLRLLANSKAYPARSALGDLLINLACQTRCVTDRPRIAVRQLQSFIDKLANTRFREPTWDHIQLDVWDVQAALLPDCELPAGADADTDTVRKTRDAHRDLMATQALRERLLGLLRKNVSSPVQDLVETFFELGRFPDRIRDAEKALRGHAQLHDLMRLLFRHPLWNVAETAASVLASLAEHAEEGKVIVRTLLAPGDIYWRERFGAVETAYQLVDVDYRLFAEGAVDNFYGDANSRVRALCAENLIAYILDRAPRLRPDYLKRFGKPIARWVEDQDCWVLEHVFRLLTSLACDGHNGDYCSALLKAAKAPLLDGLGDDWSDLSRATFLAHIEERKRRLVRSA